MHTRILPPIDDGHPERLGLSTLESISQLILQSHGLDQTLRNIVHLVADRMQTEVCSIYLCEDDRLTMQATVGLTEDSVGRVNLKIGEGLIGYTAETRSVVNIVEPQNHPRFHYVIDSNEESYHSFLGIPLYDRQTLIGVMAIQSSEPRHFSSIEISTLSTIAFQLSTVVASARLLDLLDRETANSAIADAQSAAAKVSTHIPVLKGKVGFGGVAIGPAHLIDNTLGMAEFGEQENLDPTVHLKRLYEAIEKSQIETLCLEKRVADRLGEEDAAIFHSHLMILQDRVLIDKVRAQIEQGRSASGAVKHIVAEYVEAFRRMDDAYLRERAVDVEDIGRRILSHLCGQQREVVALPRPSIVVAKDLLPSDMVMLDHNQVLGFVLESGDGNGHAVIVAKSLGIPTLIGVKGATRQVKAGNSLILDGHSGSLHVEPAKAIRKEYDRLVADSAGEQERLWQFKDRDAVTNDGVKVFLRANIGMLSDIEIAHRYGAQGIGLYRTELPYMARSAFPDRQTQYGIYRRVVENFAGETVTIRTLDIGGDKRLPYFETPKEENPFLGWRSVRISLNEREIFRTQIEAVLMAATHGSVRLMFPMVTNMDEILACKVVVAEARSNLQQEGWDVPDVPLGVMIEIPAAVALADHFAKEVDFFALGTNDLVQYMLAADRGNSLVSRYYDSMHPAVLIAIRQMVEVSQRHQKGLCICGEMASDPGAFALLVGLGLREFSVSSPAILGLKSQLAKLSHHRLEALAADAVTADRGCTIRRWVNEMLEETR